MLIAGIIGGQREGRMGKSTETSKSEGRMKCSIDLDLCKLCFRPCAAS